MNFTDKQLAWIESVVNVLSGWIVSLILVQPVVFWYFDINLDTSTNIRIATIFTLVSILRGYIWRRYFHKKFY